MSTGTSMFLWLQDCVLLCTVRMMINEYDDPVLYLKCHKGSRNMSGGLQNPVSWTRE